MINTPDIDATKTWISQGYYASYIIVFDTLNNHVRAFLVDLSKMDKKEITDGIIYDDSVFI